MEVELISPEDFSVRFSEFFRGIGEDLVRGKISRQEDYDSYNESHKDLPYFSPLEINYKAGVGAGTPENRASSEYEITLGSCKSYLKQKPGHMLGNELLFAASETLQMIIEEMIPYVEVGCVNFDEILEALNTHYQDMVEILGDPTPELKEARKKLETVAKIGQPKFEVYLEERRLKSGYHTYIALSEF